MPNTAPARRSTPGEVDPRQPLTVEDENIIHRCAWYASKHLSPALSREDLKQEGRLALLIARAEGRVPTEPLHREKYTARRVLGAMFDANSTSWRQQPMTVGELTPGTPTRPAPGQPDSICEARQAAERLLRHGSEKVIHCMELLAGGNTCEEAAAVLGHHPSRVSQLRAEARDLVACCW